MAAGYEAIDCCNGRGFANPNNILIKTASGGNKVTPFVSGGPGNLEVATGNPRLDFNPNPQGNVQSFTLRRPYQQLTYFPEDVSGTTFGIASQVPNLVIVNSLHSKIAPITHPNPNPNLNPNPNPNSNSNPNINPNANYNLNSNSNLKPNLNINPYSNPNPDLNPNPNEKVQNGISSAATRVVVTPQQNQPQRCQPYSVAPPDTLATPEFSRSAPGGNTACQPSGNNDTQILKILDQPASSKQDQELRSSEPALQSVGDQALDKQLRP